MNKTLIFLGLLLSGVYANGQKIIELYDEPIETADRKFSVVNVIDARIDTTLVGIISMGFNDTKKEKVVFAHTLSETLRKFIDHNLPRNSGGDSIVMQVQGFAIDRSYTVTHGISGGKRQVAIMKARLAFYLKKGDRYYQLIEKDYSLQEIALFIGKKHTTNLLNLLRQSLADVSNTGLTVYNRPSFSWEELNQPFQHYAIVNARQLVRGIYVNFSEFLDNKPSLENFEIIPNASDSTFRFFAFDKEGKRYEVTALTRIWGFCDGQNAYIKQNAYYFNLMIKPNGVTFVGFDYYILLRQKMIGPVVAGAVLAALSGGLLNRSSVMNATLDMGTAKAMKQAQKNIHVFEVNLDNGSFVVKE